MPPSAAPPLFLHYPVIAVVTSAALLPLLAAAYAPWRAVDSLLRHPATAMAATRFYSFDLVRKYPHDPEAFTEGLLYGGNDTLFESTGLYGRSSVRKVDLQTGKVLVQHPMDRKMFGEGLTLLSDRLFQLTWSTNVGFMYDRHNFSKCDSFTHKMRDGWGLATDGDVLFGSDGTSTLYQIDPESLQVIRMVTVKYQDNEVLYLNELEYINGEVWANVLQSNDNVSSILELVASTSHKSYCNPTNLLSYCAVTRSIPSYDLQTDCIARISPDNGLVVGWILLHGLRQHSWDSGDMALDVLNGIAWDEENSRLFVTGKLWPTLYEIKLQTVDGPPDGSIEKLCPRIIIPDFKKLLEQDR